MSTLGVMELMLSIVFFALFVNVLRRVTRAHQNSSEDTKDNVLKVVSKLALLAVFSILTTLATALLWVGARMDEVFYPTTGIDARL